jgi:hypothetical protein
LRQGYEGGIMGRQIDAECPDAVGQYFVSIAPNAHPSEVFAGMLCPIGRQVASSDESSKHGQDLDINQMRRMQLSFVREPV